MYVGGGQWGGQTGGVKPEVQLSVVSDTHTGVCICLSAALIHDGSFLPREPNTRSLHSSAETPGFWSKLIPRWKLNVMNGVDIRGRKDGSAGPFFCTALCAL